MYLKQRLEELEKLVEIAKIQSTEASNAIEGIVTTSTRIKQLVEEKTMPKNRDEQEIAGYRDVLNIIHESFDVIAKNKDLYYDALGQAQIGWHEGTEDAISFIKYLLGTALAAYKDFEDRFALVETKLPALETVRCATLNKIG